MSSFFNDRVGRYITRVYDQITSLSNYISRKAASTVFVEAEKEQSSNEQQH